MLEQKCDRCGEPISLGDPTASVIFQGPLDTQIEKREICRGCQAELEAFWSMEPGELARDKLRKARNQAAEVL